MSKMLKNCIVNKVESFIEKGVFLKCIVNGKEYNAMIDTTVDYSICGLDCSRNSGLSFPNAKCEDVKIVVGENEFTVDLTAKTTNDSRYDICLGRDFLAQCDILISPINGVQIVKNYSVNSDV